MSLVSFVYVVTKLAKVWNIDSIDNVWNKANHNF